MPMNHKVTSTPSKSNMCVLTIPKSFCTDILLLGLFLFPIVRTSLNCVDFLSMRRALPNYRMFPFLHLGTPLFIFSNPFPSIASDDGVPARILPRPLKKKSKPDPPSSEDDGYEQPGHLSTRAQSALKYDTLCFSISGLINLLCFSDPFTIVPAKMDLRAEYCPSALLVDGCPVELSAGALEYFDENTRRYVVLLSPISRIVMRPHFNLPGTSIPPSPSLSSFLSPTLALLQLLMSPLTTSVMMCFGMAPTSLLFFRCLHPFMPQILSNHYNWRIIKSSRLLSYRLGIPGADLKHYWAACMVLARCRDHLSMAVSWSWPVVVRGGSAVSQFLLFLCNFWYVSIGMAASTPSTPASTPRKNLKAFASSRPTPSTLWFERKQPSCMNFTDDSKYFFVFGY